MRVRWLAVTIALSLVSALASGCRDVSRFSTAGGSFQGPIVQGSFVRAGLASDVRMCITLDADNLQDAPGFVSTSDGLFAQTPLRPIPQVWHDPLSTLSFGEGRVSNLIYAAAPASGAADVMVVVSLMQSTGVEVRLLRGAPGSPEPSEADGGPNQPLFGVFALTKVQDPCSTP